VYWESGSSCRFEECIWRQNPSSSGSGGLIGIAVAGTVTGNLIANNIFSGFRQGSAFGFANFDSGSTGFLFHNLFYDCDVGIAEGPGDWVAINNIAAACTDGYQTDGSWGTGTDYNISNVASDAPGSNSKQATVTFVNAAGGDFHLDPTDTEAIGFGTDLSGHGTYPITRDIDGQTRDGQVAGPDWLSTGVEGELLAILPELVASIAADNPVEGTLLGALPGLVAAIAADNPVEGALVASLPGPVASIAADNHVTGSLDAVLPNLEGPPGSGFLAAVLPNLVAEIVLQNPVSGSLDATLPDLVAAADGETVVQGSLGARLPDLVAAIVGASVIEGALLAILPNLERSPAANFPGEGGSRIPIRIGIGLSI
jgi:hypothetical protein